MAESKPHEALLLVEQAEKQALDSEPDPLWAGLIAWARGRAFCHLGKHLEATAALELSVSLLSRTSDRQAAARASVSWAREHIDAGRFDDAINLLEVAARSLTGADVARASAQSALALQRAGRTNDAIDDWDRAVDAFESAGLTVEEAKARQNRGLVHAYRGNLLAAEDDLAKAAEIYAGSGEAIRGAEVLHNLGFVAARRGDLPRALALFDQAQNRAGQLGALRPEMLVDRVEVTLDAGLVREGRGLAEAAVGILERAGFDADVPEACLLVARAWEQDGDPVRGVAWARRAEKLFEAQGRPRWRLLAQFAILRADTATEPQAAGVADRLVEIGAQLRLAGWRIQATEAYLRATDLLVGAGRQSEAKVILDRETPNLHQAAPLNRLQGRLTQARLRWATGDAVGADRALVAALRALSAYQATLGSIELRTRGAGRADEVMELGVAMAAARNRASQALWWMESVRAAQQIAVDDPRDDSETMTALTSLREVTLHLGRQSVNPLEMTRLSRRQAALEELIRRRRRHAPGPGRPGRTSARLDELGEDLGDRVLVEYAVVRRRLVAVVLEDGKARLVDVAAVSEVRAAMAALRLALAVTVSTDRDAGRLTALLEARLVAERVIVEPLGLERGHDLVLVPAGPVASLPWSALPELGTVNLVVAESAAAWARAHRESRALSPAATVLVVAGPDLRHGEDEIEAVKAGWNQRVTVLDGVGATADAVTAAMGQVDVVHVAAHGTHRGDNPLLSAVSLHDGPLTGYELAQANKRTALVILSCCETGMVDTAASSGIGLSRVLTSTGIATAIASVSPVADVSSASIMGQLHRRLAHGAPPARALNEARRAVGGLLGCPSSAGFVCFGHG
ncbi:MAG TPA: CHAT domain-containing tetratricopeptide repeat protein [Acidimicrobiales bacterium]|jgi:tetratricopeptide (TPR) repeat protein|nr:CHAT domain-containing tetratricopeptide repeat protein [Acidimicrobiales bacterium]